MAQSWDQVRSGMRYVMSDLRNHACIVPMRIRFCSESGRHPRLVAPAVLSLNLVLCCCGHRLLNDQIVPPGFLGRSGSDHSQGRGCMSHGGWVLMSCHAWVQVSCDVHSSLGIPHGSNLHGHHRSCDGGADGVGDPLRACRAPRLLGLCVQRHRLLHRHLGHPAPPCLPGLLTHIIAIVPMVADGRCRWQNCSMTGASPASCLVWLQR